MFWVLHHPKDKAEYFKDDDGNLLDPIKLPIFGLRRLISKFVGRVLKS